MWEESVIVLKNIDELYPIEGYIETLLESIRQEIIKDGIWTQAIKIERNNRILDGHHRYEIAKRLNLKKIPVIIFDYNDVEMWSLRKEFIITKEDVYRNSLIGNLYPYKTVKHKFPNVNDICKIDIEILR